MNLVDDGDLTGPTVMARGPIRLKKLASISFYNDRRTHTKYWEPIRSTNEEIIITSKYNIARLLCSMSIFCEDVPVKISVRAFSN